MNPEFDVTGVLLAGGLSRRMGGGDKTLLKLGGLPILQHVIDRVSPQVSRLLLNVNGDTSRFTDFKIPIIADVTEGHLGPLVGILTGMEWVIKNAATCRWIVTLPTDAPFIPKDMVFRFFSQLSVDNSDIVCAVSKDRIHPPFALWNTNLYHDLKKAIIEEEMRKIDKWTSRYNVAYVEFKNDKFDPFFNINNPENFDQACTIFENFFNKIGDN